MNLYELLIHLDGKCFLEREEALDDMCVDAALRPAIHQCFNRSKLVRDSSEPERHSCSPNFGFLMDPDRK